MAAELKQTDEGGFQIVEEGKDPQTVKPEELLEAYQKANTDITGQTLEVTVDGSKRTVTVGDAMKAFEKVAGADQRFEAAAEKERTADRALQVQQILTKMNTQPGDVTEAEFKSVLTNIGVPQDQVAQATEMFQALQTGQFPGGGNVSDTDTGDVVPLEKLPPEVRQMMADQAEVKKTLTQQNQQQLVEGFREKTKKALTSNEYLAKILEAEADGKPVDWDQNGSWAQDLFDEAWTKVLSKVGVQQLEATPELFEGIAQEIRNRLERRYGKAGSGPGQDDNTSLGPATVLPPSVTPKKPPERVPVGEPGRSGNIAARLVAMVAGAKGGKS